MIEALLILIIVLLIVSFVIYRCWICALLDAQAALIEAQNTILKEDHNQLYLSADIRAKLVAFVHALHESGMLDEQKVHELAKLEREEFLKRLEEK